jgi:hypothetical protein
MANISKKKAASIRESSVGIRKMVRGNFGGRIGTVTLVSGWRTHLMELEYTLGLMGRATVGAGRPANGCLEKEKFSTMTKPKKNNLNLMLVVFLKSKIRLGLKIVSHINLDFSKSGEFSVLAYICLYKFEIKNKMDHQPQSPVRSRDRRTGGNHNETLDLD